MSLNPVFVFYILTTIVVAALAGLTIHARRRTLVKICALALTAMLLVLAWGALTELLGRSKPRRLALFDNVIEGELIAGHLVRGESIHIWVDPEGRSGPRAWVLPWDERTADELSKALDRKRDGARVEMQLPFEPSLDGGPPLFHDLPQPALPPKPEPSPEDGRLPFEFDSPGRST